MAVPGSPLDPRSHGCNEMIREGAVLIQRAEDIIELIASFDGVPVRISARMTAISCPISGG
jgi:DNA processing protein